RARLAAAAKDAAGVKTIIAYRSGFDIDLSRPDEAAVRDAASRWIDAAQPAGGGGPARLDDQVLLRFGLHAAVDLGLPMQVHTGLGDRDLDLHKVNPLLLLDFLRIPEVAAVPVVLLHCYPYHREAGYLAQAFHNVYFDVGLSVNFLGARSLALVAESFELAPFAKQLYSSDAWGPPELHYLGAVLWRRATRLRAGLNSAGLIRGHRRCAATYCSAWTFPSRCLSEGRPDGPRMAETAGHDAPDWTEPGLFTVAPGVHRIPLPLPNDGLRAVNVYAIESGDDLVLVDAGWALEGSADLLEAALARIDRGL